jgi:hypothetical protein
LAINSGLVDVDETVRADVVDCGSALINQHGSECVPLLLSPSSLEGYLESAAATDEGDYIRFFSFLSFSFNLHHMTLSPFDFAQEYRQGVVVFMGSLAKHLDKESPKLKNISTQLLDTLNTPSEPVQTAVAQCLIPLVPLLAADVERIIPMLMDRLLVQERFVVFLHINNIFDSFICLKLVFFVILYFAINHSFAERRGAAFGLAGVIKGLGLPSLGKYKIMEQLKVLPIHIWTIFFPSDSKYCFLHRF